MVRVGLLMSSLYPHDQVAVKSSCMGWAGSFWGVGLGCCVWVYSHMAWCGDTLTSSLGWVGTDMDGERIDRGDMG